MTRRGLFLAGLLVASSSCDWRKFDDLQNTTWLDETSRDDTGLSGDAFVSTAAVATANGATFVLSAWPAGGSGMGEVMFDQNGAKTNVFGYPALTMGGTLSPITADKTAESLAAFDSTHIVVGVPNLHPSAGGVVMLKNDLTGGVEIGNMALPNQSGVGGAIAVGNLGFGGTSPDVVAVGDSQILIIPGNTSTGAKTCGFWSPQAPNTPLVALSNVAIADVRNIGHGQVVVSGFKADRSPHIIVFDAVPAVNGAACPTDIDISLGAVGMPAPSSLAVGNLDADSHFEIVTGVLASEVGTAAPAWTGQVKVYQNVTNGSPTSVTLTVPANSGAASFGSRVLIANVDPVEDTPEIVVSDPGATPNMQQDGGQVAVYKLAAPTTPIAVLSLPNVNKEDRFGRDIVTAHFPLATSKQEILGVAGKNLFWTYFKVVDSTPDPRMH